MGRTDTPPIPPKNTKRLGNPDEIILRKKKNPKCAICVQLKHKGKFVALKMSFSHSIQQTTLGVQLTYVRPVHTGTAQRFHPVWPGRRLLPVCPRDLHRTIHKRRGRQKCHCDQKRHIRQKRQEVGRGLLPGRDPRLRVGGQDGAAPGGGQR